MKEWAKSDCRFGILVKNYIEKVTSDVSDVSDVTDVTDVTSKMSQTLQTLHMKRLKILFKYTVFHQDSESAISFA